ncbi:hypothetical protein MTO96_048724 [Rhipicephalus appendiculatus]
MNFGPLFAERARDGATVPVADARNIACTARFLVWRDALMIDFVPHLGFILSSGGILHGIPFRCTFPSRFRR